MGILEYGVRNNTLAAFFTSRIAVIDSLPASLSRGQQRYISTLCQQATPDALDTYTRFGVHARDLLCASRLASCALVTGAFTSDIFAEEQALNIVTEYFDRRAGESLHPGAWHHLTLEISPIALGLRSGMHYHERALKATNSTSPQASATLAASSASTDIATLLLNRRR